MSNKYITFDEYVESIVSTESPDPKEVEKLIKSFGAEKVNQAMERIAAKKAAAANKVPVKKYWYDDID